jgi:hypothetical protein
VLNDLRWPVRLLVASFGLAVGVILGGPLAGAGSAAVTLTLLGGLVVELAVMGAFVTWLGRTERAFRRRVAAATTEIARGEVVPHDGIGRLVRRRVVPLAAWSPARGGRPEGAGLTVFTALGDGPPRRVAALVPLDLDLRDRDLPAVLLLHPEDAEVAALDDRVDHDRLVAVHADPRWAAERLPTDRTVVGGYAALLAAFAAGLVVAGAASAAVVTLAT